jgi:chromosome segregation ATPase
LNGGSFADSPLQAGDVLRVGPVELAVMACPQARSGSQGLGTIRQQPVQEPADFAEVKREQQRHAAELAAMGEELRAAREQLEQARQGNGEASVEHTPRVNQLREQYAEALERFLNQQREERKAVAAREEQLQKELSQAQQNARDQERLFAEREAALQRQLAGQRLGEQTDLTARLVEQEKTLAQRDAELAELRQRAARLSTADERLKQLEKTLQSTTAIQQTQRDAWQQERTTLEVACSGLRAERAELEAAQSALIARQESAEFQAALDQKSAAARCESLERQITELQTRLEQTLAAQPVEAGQGQVAAQLHEQEVERWQSEARTWQMQAVEIESQLCEMKQLCATQQTEIVELKVTADSNRLAEGESQTIDALQSQLEMQRQELAEARTQFQEEQAQLGRLLAETSSREEVIARFEAEFQERQAAWELARAEQASALEERSQLIASQIAQFEAEQAAFSRQQATIIQQMSSLEDRVQELTTASESRTTNSPFVIPRLDHSSLQGELELATQPYVRAESTRSVEAAGHVTQVLESPSAKVTAGIPSEPIAEHAGEVNSVVNRLMQAGLWKGNESDSQEESVSTAAAPVPQKPAYIPPSFLDQAAEMIRQEELEGTANQPEADVPRQATPAQEDTGSASPEVRMEEDDSIEQYMSRLLSRVRGSTSPATDTPEAPAEVPAVAPSQEIAPAEIEKPAEPKEYVPRTAPEQPERLSLMRELANSAAKSAIHTHARQHQKRETKAKSLVALLSLTGALSLFVVACFIG